MRYNANKKPTHMRKGFTMIELVFVAVVLAIATYAALRIDLSNSRTERVTRTFKELTTMLHFITATDSTNMMTGFLRSGENCLDNSFKDTTGDKAVFDKMVLCLGADNMGSYSARISGVGAASHYSFLEASCSLKMMGDPIRDDTFVFTIDCSSFPVASPNSDQKKERIFLLKSLSDWVSTKEEWGLITKSATLDADSKILTIEMRY